MPTISGNVADAGFAVPALARAVFRIPTPAFDTTGIAHVTEDVVVPVDAAGAFTVVLPEYVSSPRPTPVHVGFAWWEHATDITARRAPRTDWLTDPIYIPRGDSRLSVLIGRQIGNDLVYVAPNAIDPLESTGFQMNSDTGDLYQWRD